MPMHEIRVRTQSRVFGVIEPTSINVSKRNKKQNRQEPADSGGIVGRTQDTYSPDRLPGLPSDHQAGPEKSCLQRQIENPIFRVADVRPPNRQADTMGFGVAIVPKSPKAITQYRSLKNRSPDLDVYSLPARHRGVFSHRCCQHRPKMYTEQNGGSDRGNSRQQDRREFPSPDSAYQAQPPTNRSIPAVINQALRD